MNQMNSVIEPAASQAHDAVDRNLDRAMSKAAPAIDKASDLAHRTINRVADAAAPAAEWALQSGQLASEKYQTALESCTTFVRARPMATVAGALFVGYLFGRFNSR